MRANIDYAERMLRQTPTADPARPAGPQDDGAAARDRLYDKEEQTVRPGEFYLEPTDMLIDQHRDALWTTRGMTADHLRGFKDEFYAARKETNLPSSVMMRAAELIVEDHLKDAQVDTDEEQEQEATAREATRQTTDERTRERLALKYGQEEAAELLRRTNRFVHAHPRFARLVTEYGLGRDEEFVARLVATIFSSGWRG